MGKTNSIDITFKNKSKDILNIYFTAGYPSINSTNDIIKHLIKSGVDIIEVGIPYSDPIADGLTIQKSSEKALENGMSLNMLIMQLKEIKPIIKKVPVILMGYINPILQYGIESFCKHLSEIGIAGTIIPDLPVHIYKERYSKIFDKYNLHNIFLITPQTSDQRLKKIFSLSKGFIYMVSSASITGAKETINDSQISYFKRINEYASKIPKLIGFGISNHKSFLTACNYANGAIIGSAFINHLTTHGVSEKSINNFIVNIRGKNK